MSTTIPWKILRHWPAFSENPELADGQDVGVLTAVKAVARSLADPRSRQETFDDLLRRGEVAAADRLADLADRTSDPPGGLDRAAIEEAREALRNSLEPKRMDLSRRAASVDVPFDWRPVIDATRKSAAEANDRVADLERRILEREDLRREELRRSLSEMQERRQIPASAHAWSAHVERLLDEGAFDVAAEAIRRGPVEHAAPPAERGPQLVAYDLSLSEALSLAERRVRSGAPGAERGAALSLIEALKTIAIPGPGGERTEGHARRALEALGRWLDLTPHIDVRLREDGSLLGVVGRFERLVSPWVPGLGAAVLPDGLPFWVPARRHESIPADLGAPVVTLEPEQTAKVIGVLRCHARLLSGLLPGSADRRGDLLTALARDIPLDRALPDVVDPSVIFGREAEIEAICRAPGAVLVAGPGGGGKTTLLRAARDRLLAAGYEVCEDTGQTRSTGERTCYVLDDVDRLGEERRRAAVKAVEARVRAEPLSITLWAGLPLLSGPLPAPFREVRAGCLPAAACVPFITGLLSSMRIQIAGHSLASQLAHDTGGHIGALTTALRGALGELSSSPLAVPELTGPVVHRAIRGAVESLAQKHEGLLADWLVRRTLTELYLASAQDGASAAAGMTEDELRASLSNDSTSTSSEDAAGRLPHVLSALAVHGLTEAEDNRHRLRSTAVTAAVIELLERTPMPEALPRPRRTSSFPPAFLPSHADRVLEAWRRVLHPGDAASGATEGDARQELVAALVPAMNDRALPPSRRGGFALDLACFQGALGNLEDARTAADEGRAAFEEANDPLGLNRALERLRRLGPDKAPFEALTAAELPGEAMSPATPESQDIESPSSFVIRLEQDVATATALRARASDGDDDAAHALWTSIVDRAERLGVPGATVAAFRRFQRSPLLTKVVLRNFRNIEELEIGMGSSGRLPGRWTCIIGINGAGKSAILQAIAYVLLGPNRSEEIGRTLLPDVRRRHPQGVEDATISAEVRTGADLHLLSFKILENGIHDIAWRTNNEGMPSPEALWASLRQQLVLVAYGTGRNVSVIKDNRHELKDEDVQRVMTLFDPHAPVLASAIVMDPRSTDAPLQKLVRALVREVLPEIEVVEDAEHGDRLRLRGDGALVKVTELPDGFRTTLTWLVDLCAAWRKKAPHESASADPSQIRAVVLIDEIDLHVHPSLQRELVPRLRRALPQVQWIVTTHSPLILSCFDKREIVMLEGGGVPRRLDRQILGFSMDEIYEWLMGTPPIGGAVEELFERGDRDADVFLSLSPNRSEEQARQNIEWYRANVVPSEDGSPGEGDS